MPSLRVPATFFSSSRFPSECLYTGRTAKVEITLTRLFRFADGKSGPATASATVPQTAEGYYFVEIPIPRARSTAWEHLRRSDFFWVLSLFWLPLGVGLLKAKYLDDNTGSNGLMLAALLIALGGGVSLAVWMHRKNVRVDLVNGQGEVEIFFPTHMEARQEQYAAALAEFLATGGAESVPMPAVADTWLPPPDASTDPNRGALAARAGSGSDGTDGGNRRTKLLVTMEFMNSTFVPRECFYSGRRDSVQPIFEGFDVPGFGVAARRVLVAIPQRPWARRIWGWKRHLSVFLALLTPVLGLFAGIVFDEPTGSKNLTTSLMCGGGALGMVIGIVADIWARLTTTNRQIVGKEGNIELRFSANRYASYRLWQEAFAAYDAAMQSGQPIPQIQSGGPAWSSVDNEADAESENTGWDETTRKR